MLLVATYLVAVFLGGALLAPWLHALVQTSADLVPEFAAKPFHRYVNYSLQAFAVLGMVPLLRHLGIRSLAGIGLGADGDPMRRIGVGFVLGLASLGGVAGIAVLLGARTMRPEFDLSFLAGKVAGAMTTATIVAVLEEVLYRGAFYGALRRSLRPATALLMSSAIYAIVHFLESAPHTGSVVWSSGLAILPRMLAGFLDVDKIIPGFFNLTFAGVLLGLAYARTGGLWLPIGIHAGWIFSLRLYRLVTQDGGPEACALCGSVKLVDGWLTLAALASVLAAVLALTLRERDVSPPAGESPRA